MNAMTHRTVPLDLLVRVQIMASGLLDAHCDTTCRCSGRLLLAELTAQIEQQPCKTCGGIGMIGGPIGQTPESFEYVSEPCPDCNAPEQQRQGQGEPVAWMVWYEDRDMRPQIFAGEGAEKYAREFWDKAQISWSCYLFASVAGPHRISQANGVPLAPLATPQDSVPAWAMELAKMFREAGKGVIESQSCIYDYCADQLESRALALAQTKG